MFWIGKKQAPEIDTFAVEMQAWKTRAQTVSAQLDSTQKLIVEMRAENTRLAQINQVTEQKADRIKIAAAKTHKELERVRDSIVAMGKDTSTVIFHQAEGYRREVSSLQMVIDLKETVIANQGRQILNLDANLVQLTQQADSLQKVIAQAPPPPKPHKFLGIFTPPSRIASFVAGAAVGIGGAIVLILK